MFSGLYRWNNRYSVGRVVVVDGRGRWVWLPARVGGWGGVEGDFTEGTGAGSAVGLDS